MVDRILGSECYRVDISNFEHGVHVQEFLDLRSALELVARSLPDAPRQWTVRDGVLRVHALDAGVGENVLLALSRFVRAPLPFGEQMELLRVVAQLAGSTGEEVVKDSSEGARTSVVLPGGMTEAMRLRVLQSSRIWPSMEGFLVSNEEPADQAED